MKEQARAARHDAYLAAKERRKADPRTAELKARMKAARREASAKVKELRKTDPKHIALKEKLKQGRRAANEQRKTAAKKDDGRGLSLATKPVLELVLGKPDGDRTPTIASLRAALTLIQGGTIQKTQKT